MLSAPFSNWPACVEPHRYIRWPTFFIWANEIWSKTEGDLHTPRVRYTNILASCHTPIMVAHMKSWKWYKELRCNINRTRSRSPAIARRSRSSWMPFRRATPRWAFLMTNQSETITPLLDCLIHIPQPSSDKTYFCLSGPLPDSNTNAAPNMDTIKHSYYWTTSTWLVSLGHISHVWCQNMAHEWDAKAEVWAPRSVLRRT